ncbi:RNA polymerase sigma factor [Actinospongicola halichondriae]|uniref:RNA polymerase sigma factor n=1 Tax=Actinospongicola halichondriae TaxID=3236844 RepID=UPI003D527C19
MHDDARTDGALLTAGDGASFAVFYDRHVGAVLRFLHRRTDCAETASDLCAEVFAAAYVHRRRFRGTDETARGWLFGIARNQLGHFLRRRRVADRYRHRLGIEWVPLGETGLERVEELVDAEPFRSAMSDALESLPEALSTAVMLRVGHDLPYSTVAERLGCTEGAARVRVSRGLSRLADLLEDT